MSGGVKVWDLPVRLTHLGLIVCVIGAYGSAEWSWLDMQWHFYFGYGAIVLVLFRVLWGFFGGEHARFRNFISGPGAVIGYLRGLFSKNSEQSIGHSALGGWAVLALLAAIFAQAFSGLFNSDDISWFGPLNDRLSYKLLDGLHEFHEVFPNVLMALIGLHIVAALMYWLFKKQNLIKPMITGRKSQIQARDARAAPLWLALILLALSAAALWALIRFWPAA